MRWHAGHPSRALFSFKATVLRSSKPEPLPAVSRIGTRPMEELLQLVDAGVLDASEVEMVAPLAFGPTDVLLDQRRRIASSSSFRVFSILPSHRPSFSCVRQRFEASGGLVLERTPVRGVTVHPDGAAVSLGSPTAEEDAILHARLVVDCIGHRSPIALQQRAGQAPSGVCVQVGSCARGEWQSSGALL